jgi:hypothetical protein
VLEALCSLTMLSKRAARADYDFRRPKSWRWFAATVGAGDNWNLQQMLLRPNID